MSDHTSPSYDLLADLQFGRRDAASQLRLGRPLRSIGEDCGHGDRRAQRLFGTDRDRAREEEERRIVSGQSAVRAAVGARYVMSRAEPLAVGARLCGRGRVDTDHPHAAERQRDEQGGQYEVPHDEAAEGTRNLSLAPERVKRRVLSVSKRRVLSGR